MKAETPVGRHVNCPLLLPGLLIFNFLCFLHVSKLWISLQEDGFIKSYNSVFYMHQVEYCDQYARFDLQVCLQIVMRMIYCNKRNVCLFVCVCVCVGRGRPSYSMWRHLSHYLTTDSTSDTGACHMFRHVQSSRPNPLLFCVYLFYFAVFFCPSCTILRHPSTPPPRTSELFICS